MAIRVSHTPVGALTELARKAGQAAGRQELRSRDLAVLTNLQQQQFQSAREAAARYERQEERQRAFELQKLGASRLSRQRSVTPNQQARRKTLETALQQARQSGLYKPYQLEQAKILAQTGDEAGVLGILRRPEGEKATGLPQAEKHLQAVQQLKDKRVHEIESQIETLDEQLKAQYGHEDIVRIVKENPRFTSEENQQLIAQMQALQQQREAIEQQFQEVETGIQFGMTVPQMLERQEKRAAAAEKEDQERREAAREAMTELTGVEKLNVQQIRSQTREQRSRLATEIKELRRQMQPFKDEDEEELAERTAAIRNQINQRQREIDRLYAAEQHGIAQVTQQIIQTPDGTTWRWTGRIAENGEPEYTAVSGPQAR